MTDSVRLRWASPRYRGAIYAGTMADPTEIKIDSKIEIDSPIEDYTFDVEITRSGSIKTFTGIQATLLEQQLVLDVDSITFQETRSGPYVIDDTPYNVDVRLRRGGATTASLSLDLHKYPAAPGGQKEVRYDDHGRFVVDGVLTAWFGGYVYDGQSYKTSTYEKFKNDYKLDTIFGVTTSDPSPLTWKIPKVSSYYYKLSEPGNPDDLRENFYQNMREDSDLICYVGCDEPRLSVHKPDTDPNKRDPVKVKQIYDIATEEDPYHPCVNVDTFGVSISRYNVNNAVYHDFTACQDALWTDSYPIRNRDNLDHNGKVSLFQVYANRLIWLGQLNTPSYVDYQTSAEENMLWEDQNMIQGSVPQIQGRIDYNDPYKEELTNIVYQGIVTGATQLCPFAWEYDGAPQHDVAWRDFGSLIDDIRAEGSWLVLGEQLNEKIQLSYTGIATEELQVAWCRRVSPTHEYIVVINMTYQWNYLSQLRDTPIVGTLTFEQSGNDSVEAILRDSNISQNHTLVNNSMTFTLDGVNVGNNRAGVVVFKRSINPAAGAKPVISPIDNRTNQAANLPRDYYISGYCSSDSGALRDYTITLAHSGFIIDSITGVITARDTVPTAANQVSFSVTNDEGSTEATFTWTITAAAGVIDLSIPYAVDITPTEATIGCTSDSLEGTLYAGVSTDEYTDKSVLKDPNNAQHVWQGEKPGAINNSFAVTGTSPEIPYYTGFYQADDITPANEIVDFRTDVGAFTFSRASEQTGAAADGTMVNQGTDLSVHPGADWDGQFYTNTSNKAMGVLLEPSAVRLNLYQYSVDLMEHQRVTTGGSISRGALTIEKMEEDATLNTHYVRQGVTLNPDTIYCHSIICKADERDSVDLLHNDIEGGWYHTFYNFVNMTLDFANAELLNPSGYKINDELSLVWYGFDSGSGANPPVIGAGIIDPANPVGNDYLGVPPSGFYFSVSLEEGKVPTSPMNGEGVTQSRATTSLTSTLATLGFTAATNDISGQLPVVPHFNYDSDVGFVPLMTLGTGNDKIELDIDGGNVSLTKTYGGASAKATVPGLTYAYGDRLNIKWMISSTGGIKLWVGTATDTVAQNTAMSVAPTAIVIHPSRTIVEQFRYKNTADETEIAGWA